jgi:hypothetical protein
VGEPLEGSGGVAAILAISGSMLWVGGPLFALFLIVKLLEFF